MTLELSNLPADVLLEILLYLDASDVATLSQVCRNFHMLVENTESLWKHMCRTLVESQRDILLDHHNGYSWKEAFQMNYGKNGIIRKWKQGQFSNFSSASQIPPCSMTNISKEIWGEILQSELDRS